MSRASNLAGFITAISPTIDLSVGVLTATTFDLGGTISFDSISATSNIAIGGTVAGVTTITGTGINQPLGINTLGQTEFTGAVDFNSSVTIAGVTTINSDGVQSTGIGTFSNVAIGTDNAGSSQIYASSKGYTTVSIRTDDDATGWPLLQFVDERGGGSYQIEGGRYDGKFSIRTNSGLVPNNQKDRIILNESGNVGLGSTAPTVSVDISEKTDAVALPVGTTAQRPATAYGGYIRWNSTSSALEVYNGTNWVELISDYFPSGSTTLG